MLVIIFVLKDGLPEGFVTHELFQPRWEHHKGAEPVIGKMKIPNKPRSHLPISQPGNSQGNTGTCSQQKMFGLSSLCLPPACCGAPAKLLNQEITIKMKFAMEAASRTLPGWEFLSSGCDRFIQSIKKRGKNPH